MCLETPVSFCLHTTDSSVFLQYALQPIDELSLAEVSFEPPLFEPREGELVHPVPACKAGTEGKVTLLISLFPLGSEKRSDGFLLRQGNLDVSMGSTWLAILAVFMSCGKWN